MWANSLWARLIASSAAIAIVLLVSAAVLLNAAFVQALQRNFDQRLKSAMDGVLANIELAQDGKPQVTTQLADTRFSLPLSGWYWQISNADGQHKLLSSPSLLEQQLIANAADLATRDRDGIAALSLRDQQGANLRVVEQDVKLFNGQDIYAVMVAGNFDELRSEVAAFQHTLFFMLGALGLALMAGLMIQVRFTLQPIADLQHQLNDIRSGKAEFLGENFPREIQPVADELNLLVESNLEIVERSRMQVGNLAHALKTPISVLNNEARDSTVPLAARVKEQIEVMRDQVNLYLDRARRAARAQSIGSAPEVEPVLQSLARTLQRINSDRKLLISVEATPGLKFRGERQDLEEIVGNLMDNACKWAKSKVKVTASPIPHDSGETRLWLTIVVEDDGPGIPADKRATALQRGKRLDESKPGSGLGMSIISETAAMYSGGLTLGEAHIGGLKANLKLPMAG